MSNLLGAGVGGGWSLYCKGGLHGVSEGVAMREEGTMVTSWVKISFPPLNNSDGDVSEPGYYALLTRKNRRGENGRRFA